MNTILDEVRNYFKKTPREKVLKDWQESSNFDDVGPTAEEFLNQDLFIVNLITSELNRNVKFIKKYPNQFGVFFITKQYF